MDSDGVHLIIGINVQSLGTLIAFPPPEDGPLLLRPTYSVHSVH